MNEQELKKLIAEKENQIGSIRREILKLKQQLLPLQTSLNEGDVVVNEKGQKGVICYNGNETFWWGVRKYKKDGELSAVIQHAYNDWRKVEDETKED